MRQSKLDTSIPVVVLGTGNHGSLAIVRSLGSLGVAVYVVEARRFAPSRFSRLCRGGFQWDLRSASAKDSVAFLTTLAVTLRSRPILIPASDHAALFVVDHAQDLAAHYLFPAQSAQLSHALINKNQMFQLASRHAVPTPYTIRPESKQELLDVLGTCHYPLIIKADSSGGEPAKPKSIVRSQSEFWEKYDRGLIPDAFRFVVQEYIPGHEDTTWMFNGYFNHRSECLFGMTGQKLRQCPVDTGPACLAVCLPNEAVRQTTLRFAEAIDYKGILDIDYRYDERDRQYKIVDFNPRIGSSFRLFLDTNGMDVARAMYSDLTGQEVRVAEAIPGRKWIVEDRDLVSSFHYFRDGNLLIAEWLRSYRGLRELSWVSFTDPLPAFAMLASDVRKLPARLQKRAGSLDQPLHFATGDHSQRIGR